MTEEEDRVPHGDLPAQRPGHRRLQRACAGVARRTLRNRAFDRGAAIVNLAHRAVPPAPHDRGRACRQIDGDKVARADANTVPYLLAVRSVKQLPGARDPHAAAARVATLG